MGGRIEDEWKTEEEREEERKAVLAGEKTVEKMGQGMGAKDVMACWSTWMSSRGGGRLVPSMGEYYGFSEFKSGLRISRTRSKSYKSSTLPSSTSPLHLHLRSHSQKPSTLPSLPLSSLQPIAHLTISSSPASRTSSRLQIID